MQIQDAAEETRDEARERVFERVQSAFTRQEIQDAQATLTAHLASYPEDARQNLEQDLQYRSACLKEREEQARDMDLCAQEKEEREQMLRQAQIRVDPAQDPECLKRIEAAQAQVTRWLVRYPEDVAAQSQLQALSASHMLAQELVRTLKELEPHRSEASR